MLPASGRRLGYIVLLASVLALETTSAPAETTPQSPSSAQPAIPDGAVPASPVVETIVGRPQEDLVVYKRARRRRSVHWHVARRWHRRPFDVERPALAGVQVLAPVPPPGEPPHIVVPMPEYPLDALATSFLIPPPPVVCHRTRRIRDVPDPHLYKEVTLDCVPDNP